MHVAREVGHVGCHQNGHADRGLAISHRGVGIHLVLNSCERNVVEDVRVLWTFGGAGTSSVLTVLVRVRTARRARCRMSTEPVSTTSVVAASSAHAAATSVSSVFRATRTDSSARTGAPTTTACA